jgi:hypothetical protein
LSRKVEVYWNARVRAFSVRENAFGRGNIVVGHARRLLIRDATFSVSAAGRRRVIETGHKNVHAFVRGELHAVQWEDTFVHGYRYLDNWTRGDGAYASVARKRLGVDVSYNPRIHETFVDRSASGEILGPRTEAPMTYLWRFDKSPAILAFDPLLMTEAESKAATV